MQQPPKTYFITGIGTGVGKTVAAAIVVKALGADYWKPVQCGDLDRTDTMKVQRLTGCAVHLEAYRLELPMSPHAAGEAEGVRIDLAQLRLPHSERPLLVEGAGGILVPLNDSHTMLDLMQQLNIPVIVVSRHCLGSINHTLMTLEVLKQRGITVAGIIFNGDELSSSESIIAQLSGAKVLGRVPVLDEVSPASVSMVADSLRERLLQAL
ncbi:MAG: dethiobiotin synthase [Flavobacteriales bacterium]|nr:dethiobiotin synthase [Flavobacteriales bacterium]